jgi:hypothetical protein
MLYMLLLYGFEGEGRDPAIPRTRIPMDGPFAETKEAVADPDVIQAYAEFTDWIVKRGNHRDGAPLAPPAMATSVRVRDGKTLTTDGPFAITGQVLGGYYLIDAANLDEAIEIAARVPRAKSGTVEIRPLA